jgi:hypothetical protein
MQLLSQEQEDEIDASQREADALIWKMEREREAKREQVNRAHEQEIIRKMVTEETTRQAPDDGLDGLDPETASLLDAIGEVVGQKLNEVLQKINAIDERVGKLESDAAVARAIARGEVAEIFPPKKDAAHAS